VIGVVRKLSGWNLGSIIGEYRTFAEPKARECDIEYITRFQLGLVSNLFREPSSPPLRRASLRATSFARAAVFALVVLVVWLASGPTAVVVQDGVVAARGQESLRGGPVTGGAFA
jgi:tyrosine-protein phosphatase SIW14